MPTFRPPTDDIVPPNYIDADGHDASGWQDSTPAINRLMSRYAARPRGRNVFLLADGSVTEDQPYGYQSVAPNDLFPTGVPDDQRVVRVFWGATTSIVSDAEAAILTAAGYTVEADLYSNVYNNSYGSTY